MTLDFRLGDMVKDGSRTECAFAMRRAARALQEAGRWMQSHAVRNDKSVALQNLIEATAKYLKSAATNIEGDISIVALCTRNIYEINLQVRDILLTPNGLQRWLGESVTDEIDLLEGILLLESDSDTSNKRKPIQDEIERLLSLREKHSLPSARPAPAAVIAKRVDLSGEHQALFKLFSKLVHPSSYLVNNSGRAESSENHYVLQVHAQLYAWDTFLRICDDVSLPDEIRRKIEVADYTS